MSTPPLLQRVHDLMRSWTDDDFAVMLGIAPATAKSYRLGQRAEYLSAAHKGALARELRIHAREALDMADELELFG